MGMHIRAVLGVSSLLLVGGASAQVAPAPASLVGTWEAIARSSGGLGSTLSFGSDNSLSFTIGAMVDMRYRRTRDSLFIIDQDGRTTPSRVTIVRDTLISVTDDREQRETRVGPALPGDSLLGQWTYEHYTGATAFEEYTHDGQLHLRVPIRTLKGTYATAGDSAMLHLPGPGGGDRAVRFAVTGDTLQLTWSGQTSRYLKATPLGR